MSQAMFHLPFVLLIHSHFFEFPPPTENAYCYFDFPIKLEDAPGFSSLCGEKKTQ